ncbi:MAG: glycosyltransferase family 9 protein [Mariprofundales bacterium]|nr:glycosyltransferase family 9 protein [Mariprofundales bacterium]
MRALVVVCRYLGDVLLATPLAKSLAEAGFAVEWLVAPGTEAMLENQPFASRVHTLSPSLLGLRDSVRALRASSREKFDLACVLTGSDRPIVVARLVAKRVYSLLPMRAQDGWKRHLVTDWVTNDAPSHMVSYCADLARLAGVATPENHPTPSLQWDAADAAVVRAQLGSDGGWDAETHYVHIHPFARWPYKLWPDRSWQALMRRIDEAGLRIVMTAGPGEAQAAQALAGGAGIDGAHYRVLAGVLAWPQLAALSAGAALYVGLDTANTHLAAGSGTGVVALYGPTDPRIWGPWPADYPLGRSPYRSWLAGGRQSAGNVTLLQSSLGCVPCQKEGCGHQRASSSDCLEQMGVDQVWQACKEWLA